MITNIKHDDIHAVKNACNVLDNSGVIVYPTDTLYGFGCDAKNDKAINMINQIKRRTGPMSVIAPNEIVAAKWMDLSSKDKINAQNISRGKTTIIIPIKNNVCSKTILGKNNTLGIRIPDHPFCQQLSSVYPNPITTTSVNRAGQKPLSQPDKIAKEFSNEISLIIEDGTLDGPASKIFIFNNGSWDLLRQ